MVVLDSTTLLLLIDPTVSPPLDSKTGKPVQKCKDRVDYLVRSLTEKRTPVLIPTPVLSEVLVWAGSDMHKYLSEIHSTYAMRVAVFDELAAVEVALLTDKDLQSTRKIRPPQTYAKIKYDRQIIAITKVAGATTIYSDDAGLTKLASDNGIIVIGTESLPLPPVEAQDNLF